MDVHPYAADSSSPQAAQPLRGQQDTVAPMEMEATPPPAAPVPPPAISRPRYSGTVERTFRDFTIRRAALIRAVTQDEKVLFRKCNPRMESLCLYGNTDGNWEVLPPKLFAPSSGQPEPKLGINLVRDKMRRLKWLQHISEHSDAWLIRISFFLAANLEARERQRLFTMISSLPTVQETFIASETYRRLCHLENMIDETKDEDEGCGPYPTFCASCGDRYLAKGFWVKVGQEELIKNFECPECCAEKRGHD
ncbi:PHD finger protein ALFIN-LIKE 3 [Setaria italica]|uniref:PHD finger protein ALFIN-LIKE 3 n=1 Tax=Setaria italica TaxID=4555 RepID=UPI000350C332|nr:PHD finger protein ALFIN-LIKE 3 [Setaria italica]